jgi:hypothetical protein
MLKTGCAHLDALASAETELGKYRAWARERAMSREAGGEAIMEYIRLTALLVSMDRRYWRALAEANACLVAEGRGSLSPAARQALVQRTHEGFAACYSEYRQGLRPLLAQLPDLLKNLADTGRRRDWVLSLERALCLYAYSVKDALALLEEQAQPGDRKARNAAAAREERAGQ